MGGRVQTQLTSHTPSYSTRLQDHLQTSSAKSWREPGTCYFTPAIFTSNTFCQFCLSPFWSCIFLNIDLELSPQISQSTRFAAGFLMGGTILESYFPLTWLMLSRRKIEAGHLARRAKHNRVSTNSFSPVSDLKSKPILKVIHTHSGVARSVGQYPIHIDPHTEVIPSKCLLARETNWHNWRNRVV